jgi:hypothetical protein
MQTFKRIKATIEEIIKDESFEGKYLVTIDYISEFSISKSFKGEDLLKLNPIRIDGFDCLDGNKNRLEVYFNKNEQAISFLTMALTIINRLEERNTKELNLKEDSDVIISKAKIRKNR